MLINFRSKAQSRRPCTLSPTLFCHSPLHVVERRVLGLKGAPAPAVLITVLWLTKYSECDMGFNVTAHAYT